MKSIIVVLGVLLVFGSTHSIKSEDSNESAHVIETTNDDAIEAFDLLGKIQCKLCKEAMKIVEKEVNSHSSKEEIKKTLDKACTIIPDRSLRRKCRESIEKRGDAIAEVILENLTADNICKILLFC
ncbi:saposin-C-like [Sitodiplosis mosellana]|uniref:saposin-C-like n=1 Tax=Sitodiplosis mosellana TaxID=263140 RepID=UPI002443FE56|nr:saposin-C-like [Sitodiplosis mosellana]